jgi:S-DNA-T family DNA segregation ATPase FtsK/SpoIIIE
LKVQEKADSQDMIKCPDAAELSQTGRFYLQVGFNELFALGQSAWCGAEYIPTETVEKSVDNSIQIVDNLGHVLMNVKPGKKVANTGKKVKQIVINKQRIAITYYDDIDINALMKKVQRFNHFKFENGALPTITLSPSFFSPQTALNYITEYFNN